MLFKHITYPSAPLPPLAAILLEGFEANERCREHDREGGAQMSALDYQRACALFTGARDRARECGPKDNHADQAATLLVMIDNLDELLDGNLSIGAQLPLDEDETNVLRGVRAAAVALLRWHFDNGAGALLPIAIDMGLVK